MILLRTMSCNDAKHQCYEALENTLRARTTNS